MKIRLGIIGAGENTRLKHIPYFNKISDVEIISPADMTFVGAGMIKKYKSTALVSLPGFLWQHCGTYAADNCL